RFANGLERERERRLQAEARLEHLERLVQQLAQHGDGSAPHGNTVSYQMADQQVNRDDSSIEPGVLVPKEPVFNGSTHWSAMLQDIEGLRSAIIPNEATTTDSDIFEYKENTGASLILGSAVPLQFQEVLVQYLPSRQEVDRLTAAYFRGRGVSAPFIHASYFQKLYQDFWKDPLRAPVLWTSILFSICHIAKSTLTLGKENVYRDDRYSVASAHCLALGEYFRPKRFSVESLLLFVQAKCLTSLGMSPDSGLIFGLLIRLATIMGYHRDPDIFQLSAFEREMRRRTWSLCIQLDLLISFQLGLPSNIQFPTWNTRPPRNLQDSDFDEDTKELPPARPDSESTDILFYIAKHRLMTVFEKILRHNMSTGTNESADVDELDTEIRDTYSALPEILRPRPIADSVVDSPSLIVTRLCVSFVYQKCLCVLHRPYVTRGRVYSTQVCCDAASSIVRHLNDTYQEFLPGGQLETERWFMSNITWHDYLLGVIALCLVLCASSKSIAASNIKTVETLQLLRRARDVCVEQSMRSKDSGRVQKVINATLLHFGSLGNQNNEDAMNESSLSTNSFEFSLIQSPFAGDQASAHDVMPPYCLQDFPPDQTEVDWMGSELMARPMDDTSWAYLGQFLNLSDDDLMPSS
ncbi:hypothetical protein MMC28_009304, partial [Mycoblastus sanguinarius]|nr:hypothetical protein [Mycoblastus sanguinarius]